MHEIMNLSQHQETPKLAMASKLNALKVPIRDFSIHFGSSNHPAIGSFADTGI